MNQSLRIFSLAILNFIFSIIHSTFAYTPPPIVFDTPAENDRGSMILGDGEVGAIAWLTVDGTLHTVLQRSDSWNEVGEHVKVGGIDYISSCPVDAGTYHQELSLERGEFTAAWKSKGRLVGVRYRLQWGGGNLAVCEFTGAPEAKAKDFNWRLYPGGSRKANAYELRRTINFGYQNKVAINPEFVISADKVLADLPAGMSGWYHENLKSTVDQILAIYDFSQATADLGKPDLLHDRIFGAITRTEKGAEGKTLFLSAVTCCHPCKSVADWRQHTLGVLDKQGWKLADETAKRDAHYACWREFWNRSYIEIAPNSAKAGERRRCDFVHDRKLPFVFGHSNRQGYKFQGTCKRAELVFDGKVVYTGAPKTGEVLVPPATGKMPVVPVGGSRSVATASEVKHSLRWTCEFTTSTTASQRILDNVVEGAPDGFLVDIYDERIRVVQGTRIVKHGAKVKANQPMSVVVEVSPCGDIAITVDGKKQEFPGSNVSVAEECRAVSMAWAAQRYTVRCAGMGKLPLRFNGSLFLMSEKGDFNYIPGGAGGPIEYNFDHRPWGHGFWWQNTRLPYYPMFAAGDYDMFEPLFKMYNYDLLEFLKKRTRRYLGHGGAFFPECMQPWGDHFIGCYGTEPYKDRKDKLQHHPCHKYAWIGQLELSLMMLDWYEHTDDAEWFKTKALPAIREFVRYFDEHYKLAADGRYDWQPAQAIETWFACTAPMTEVSGLTRVTDKLLALPKGLLSEEDRALFARIRSRIPELPTRKLKDGRLAYAPGHKYARKGNVEHPEMYCIFPFRLCSFEKPNAELGRTTYEVHIDHLFHGWSQEEMFATYLGMAEEARKHLVDRVLTHVQKKFRWPVYWGPNFNCCPDEDEGGIVQNIIQSMLMQIEGDKIFLAPAWPKEWNCHFKLNAPHHTTLEGRIENGQVLGLVVTPVSRRADVVLPGVDAETTKARDAKRPYEMVWAGRDKDAHKPLIAMQRADGWMVKTSNAVASFTTCDERALFGDSVCRLVYHATGANPRITLVPPAPVLITKAFDTFTWWIYGNNHSYVNDPSTPPVNIAFNLRDSQGKPLDVSFYRSHHKEWFLAQRRLSPEAIERVRKGATLVGITITGCTNTQDRQLDFTSLCAFVEEFKPLSFKPRAKRPNRVFPEISAGLNTGDGELPFPNSPLGVTPKTTRDDRLELRLPTKAGDWSELAFRWKGSEWQRVAKGGGVWFVKPEGGNRLQDEPVSTIVTNRVSPIDVTITGGKVKTRYHQEGKSLVVDVACDSLDVDEVRFGGWVDPMKPRRVTLPYYTYGWGERPGVVIADVAGAPFFHAAAIDWTQSNASRPFAEASRRDGTLAANGGTRYRAKTDGQRNVCRERFVYTFSDKFEDVLPEIPNDPSPWKHVTGKGVWRAHGASVHAKDAEYWRKVRARGLKHIIVTDHETLWRDGNESFTFRTEVAPKKGGDKGQYDYTRIMIDELGYVYGPYNNFTDFAPVNGNWSPDRVSRHPDLQFQTAWERCYAPKPAYAVEACEQFTPIIQKKFRFNTAYCDVHTAVTPWDRCDYDARVPGAGTFVSTFYAYGEIMLIQKQNWNGPVYSEGNNHFMYCGLTDGNYAQDQAYNPSVNPWLVDFDLLRIHPLCCNFGMGYESMFYPGKSAPKDPDERADRFLAATVAFGHPGFLLQGGAKNEDRGYFMVQALAARYTQVDVESIRYLDAEGKAYDTSAAVANDVFRLSQVVVRYKDGTVVCANGSRYLPMKTPYGVWLPPNGYCGWSADGKVFVYSGFLDGHRVDCSISPEYLYLDGRGMETRFPWGTTTNAVTRLYDNEPNPVRFTLPNAAFAARTNPGRACRPATAATGKPLPLLRYMGMKLKGGEETDLDGVTGASVHSTTIPCGGVVREGLFMHPPWENGKSGYVFMRCQLDLDEKPCKFKAFVGKKDGSDTGDGIWFRVELEDAQGVRKVLASQHVIDHKWVPVEADLSPWKGKRVKLYLVSDCGPAFNTGGDWAAWGDLRIENGK